jgi:N-acetylmuramic acid 6-phosphate etherase
MKSTGATTPLYLGIEGGGTRTVAMLADAASNLLQRAEFGPANLRLLDDAALRRHFRAVQRAFPRPAALCLGLAGLRTAADHARLRRVTDALWPGLPAHLTNDLETALAAAAPVQSSKFKVQGSKFSSPASVLTPRSSLPQVLVLSGTGSCFFGRAPDGRTAKFGGWGHILGDKGSGFEIGLRALKAVVFYLDRDGEWSRLGRALLRALSLNEPNDLIAWAQSATKTDIAALAVEVFRAAAKGDAIARDILEGAAESLAKDATCCASKLTQSPKSKAQSRPVQFVFSGSVLLQQPKFAAQVGKLIRARWPGAVITPLKRESAWGAVVLAQQRRASVPLAFEGTPAIRNDFGGGGERDARPTLPRSTALSPTERRNPRSMKLDRMSDAAAIALMLREDQRVPVAVLKEHAAIEQALKLVTRAFRRGGRLFYVGAGTSGRLGILDASECPPTFRADPGMVQGIIAGGARAITSAVEGAEDNYDAGGRAIEFRGVGKRDVVVGIATSGRTPFVWGALAAAKRRGAATVLLCFNPHLAIPRALRPNVVIAPDLGPEILTGSTRLKSGTATKLVLNILTTLAMVRLGKVLGNLMVDLNPSNVKLRDRAARIVLELTGADYETAKAALEQSGWVVQRAVKRLERK